MRDLFPHLRALLGPQRAKPMQRRALLRLIAFAAEERQPLAPLLEAWSYDERGAQRLRLRRLAKSLQKGTTLPDSLERFPGALSDDETLMIRFASESGTLASSIHANLELPTDPTAPIRDNLRRSTNYLLMMLLIGLPIAQWLFVHVTPSLEAINMDFGGRGTTFQLIQNLQYWLLDWMTPLGLGVLAIFVASRWLKRPWRNFRRRVAPIIFGSVRSLRVSQLLRWLSETCQAGRPLDGAVSTLARYHYDPAIRHKLLYTRNELALGADLWQSFHAVGLLSDQEVRALGVSDRLHVNYQRGVTAWTLRALADTKERRAIRWQTWLSLALSVAVVLLFGAFVLIQAIGLLSFLSELITFTA